MKCETKFCRNPKAKYRKTCNTCNSRKYRQLNPIRYAYQNLKDRAKQRNKPFELTYEQFEAFCHKYKIINGKSRKTAESYTVDCKIEELGYTVDNIQPLTLSENSRKENARRRKVKTYDWKNKEVFYSTEDIDEDFTDVPF